MHTLLKVGPHNNNNMPQSCDFEAPLCREILQAHLMTVVFFTGLWYLSTSIAPEQSHWFITGLVGAALGIICALFMSRLANDKKVTPCHSIYDKLLRYLIKRSLGNSAFISCYIISALSFIGAITILTLKGIPLLDG